MTDKLEHPATNPTTIISFDAVQKWQLTRKVDRVFKQGKTDGTAVAKSAGVSLLETKITVHFTSDSNGSALQKYWTFDDLVRQNNEEQMRLTVTVGGVDKIFDGKIEALAADWNAGEPDLVLCSFNFIVETIVA
jgi:hypothetical protein